MFTLGPPPKTRDLQMLGFISELREPVQMLGSSLRLVQMLGFIFELREQVQMLGFIFELRKLVQMLG